MVKYYVVNKNLLNKNKEEKVGIIMKRNIYLMLAVLSIVLCAVLLMGCGKSSTNTPSDSQKSTVVDKTEKGANDKNPVVTIEMMDGGKITIELYPDKAPNTVRNFVGLVQKGFYDGLIFHRVIPGFMIQGGDPKGTGTGGPGYSIAGEFSSNNFATNDIKHERGVISMARAQSPDSAGSQFFIMVKESSQLNGQYAAFGKVTSGIDVADKIVAAKRDGSDKPLEDQKMKKVTVDTFGVKYGDVIKVK